MTSKTCVAILGILFTTALQAAPPSSAAQLAHETIQRRNHHVTIEHRFPVIAGCLDKDRQLLHDKIERGESIPFNELTDTLVELHRKNGSKEATPLELNSFLLKLRTGAKRTDPHAFKESYESALYNLFKEDSFYNATAVSVADICKSNQLQCYSGTTLNQVLARKLLSRDDFQKNNPVIIYESGHVLPGYLKQEGGEWILYGIETTALGPARINYGATKSLQRAIRVIDAGDWILSEVFEDCLEKPELLAKAILDKSSKLYDIPLATTENAITAENPKQVAAWSSGALKNASLNASLFSFGTSSPRPGLIQRHYLKGKDRNSFHGSPDLAGDRTHPRDGVQGVRENDAMLLSLLHQSELNRGNPEIIKALRGIQSNATSYNPNLELDSGLSLMKAISNGVTSEDRSLTIENFKVFNTLLSHPDFDPNTPGTIEKLVDHVQNISLHKDDHRKAAYALALKTLSAISTNKKIFPEVRNQAIMFLTHQGYYNYDQEGMAFVGAAMKLFVPSKTETPK